MHIDDIDVQQVPPPTSKVERHVVGRVDGRIALLGDSNFNKVHVPDISKQFKRREVIRYSQSGATSVHLQAYADILLEEQPGSIIIHAGTNDIWGRNKRCNVSCDRIAKDIIDIGLKCRARQVTEVYISSILPTRNDESNTIRTEVNAQLELLCEYNGFVFVDNDFIIVESDLKDQVHLNPAGRGKLVDNYIAILLK